MRQFINNWIDNHYAIHKLRIDRGAMWWTKFNAVFTAILAAVFLSQVGFWYKALSAIISVVIIYFIGYIDVKMKLVDKDNKINAEKNPIMMKIVNDIEEIKQKI